MRLKNKIGQMLIVGFRGQLIEPNDQIVKDILAQKIGGVILFDYHLPTQRYDRNVKNPQQLTQLTQQLQYYALLAAKKNGSQFLPLLISTDYEGGNVTRLKFDHGFPKTFSAAELGEMNLSEVTRYAKEMAMTLKKAGINMNFAPVLDVNVNPSNPVIGQLKRSFSDDPNKVVRYAQIFTKAYQEQNILCVYKHFPGHGSALQDSHAGFVDVTTVWQSHELDPYKTLLADSSNHAMVMTAHIVHRGLDEKAYPASLSYHITKKLLRDELKFNGVVITDDLQMKAISDHYQIEEVLQLAIQSGADLLLFGNQLVSKSQDVTELIKLIYQQIELGYISEQRIHESYDRIIQLKKYLQITG